MGFTSNDDVVSRRDVCAGMRRKPVVSAADVIAANHHIVGFEIDRDAIGMMAVVIGHTVVDDLAVGRGVHADAGRAVLVHHVVAERHVDRRNSGRAAGKNSA